MRTDSAQAYRLVEHVEAAAEVGILEAALAAFAELVATGTEREPARHEIEFAALIRQPFISVLLLFAHIISRGR